MAKFPFSYTPSFSTLCALTGFALSLYSTSPALADTTSSSWGAGRVLQEALATHNGVNIYSGNAQNGLNISGGLFSGRASGIDTTANNYLSNSMSNGLHYDTTAELEGDQRVYAMLIDGSYHFANDLGTGLPLHPYMSGGVGMAMYDHSSIPSSTNLGMQSGGMVPLFRVGGGVMYQLGEAWNMSVDYKVGVSGGDQSLTAHGVQTVDMQTINMGMHYRF